MKRIICNIVMMGICFLALIVSTGVGIEASAGVSLVVDEDEQFVTIPTVYEVETTYKYMGEYGFLDHAEHLFVDSEDSLYVVDTGNNRILKFSPEGEVVAEYTEAFGTAFNNPKGIFVHEDGTIWVADTNNHRVVRINQDGTDVEVYYKPESDLLDESFTFAPEKVAVSKTGYIYVLKGSSLMKLDSNNEFRGYVGSANVPFSLSRLLIRTFGTQAQIEKTVKQEPAAYINFTIASDGMIYGILAEEDTGQIRRLNSVGTNTFPELSYGYDITMDDSSYVAAYFSDITVMDNGVVTVTDQSNGLIYQYTQDGSLLAIFGGSGNKNGVYQNISSVAHDSQGRLYVLDFSANSVTVLAPTRFISLIHEAVSLYNDGDYEASKDYWLEVLEIDANYPMAHTGYGKVLYKEGLYKEAMEQYKLGGDKEGYSKAFAEYRHEILRNYFGWICLAAIAIVALFCVIFTKSKKYIDVVNHRIVMGGTLQ